MDGPYNRQTTAERGSHTSMMAARFEENDRRARSTSRPGRSTSRPAPTVVSASSTTSSTISSTASESSSSPERPAIQPKPLKSILKVTGNSNVDPRRVEDSSVAQERSQELLARRFYRLPRPEPLQHAPPFSQALPQLSPLPHLTPNYYSDASWGNFDTETESASSELSFNTQATSVASDDTAATPAKRNQVIHIRRMPAVSRVRARARSSRASSDAGSTRSRRGRTVNIQVIPAVNKEKSKSREPSVSRVSSSRALPAPPSRELQLTRSAERDLLERIEHLEGEADSLRESRSQLGKDLHDASERLTVKEFGNREIERLLNQERTEKMYLLHDLEEQRRHFDEFRSNFELQRGMLQETEQERNNLKQTRDKLEFQLNRVTRASKNRFDASKVQEAELARQITTFEGAVVALEKKINSQEKEVHDLTRERDSFREEANKHQAQLDELVAERDGLRDESKEHLAKMEALSAEQQTLKQEKSNLEAHLRELRTRVNSFENDKDDLQMKFERAELNNKALHNNIRGFEEEVRVLHMQIQGLQTEGNTLKDQIAAFEPEKQALQKQLEANKLAFDSRLENDKQTFETELAEERADRASQVKKLTTELDGAKVANISLASQTLELATRLEETQADLKAAKNQVRELEKIRESLGAEAAQLQSRATQLEGELNTKTADIEKLETRTGDLEKLKQDLEHQRAQDLALFQEQRRSLEARISDLRADVENAQENLKAALAAAPPPPRSPSPTPSVSVVTVDSSVYDRLTQEKAELESQQSKAAATADRKIVVLEQTNERLRMEVGRIPILEAEAGKVPGLAHQARELSVQLANVQHQLQQVSAAHVSATVQVGDLQDAVSRLHQQDQYQQQQQQQQQQYQQPQVVNAAPAPITINTSNGNIHTHTHTSPNTSSSERRTKSRSSSRRRPDSAERARSTGSGEKMIFVRKPHDRSGTMYLTTREALRAADKGE